MINPTIPEETQLNEKEAELANNIDCTVARTFNHLLLKGGAVTRSGTIVSVEEQDTIQLFRDLRIDYRSSIEQFGIPRIKVTSREQRDFLAPIANSTASRFPGLATSDSFSANHNSIFIFPKNATDLIVPRKKRAWALARNVKIAMSQNTNPRFASYTPDTINRAVINFRNNLLEEANITPTDRMRLLQTANASSNYPLAPTNLIGNIVREHLSSSAR